MKYVMKTLSCVAVLLLGLLGGAYKANADTTYIPIGVGGNLIVIPILPSPSEVSIENEAVSGSYHELSWASMSNASYYEILVVDENGNEITYVTFDTEYSLVDLPLGMSQVYLFACNGSGQCGLGYDLGQIETTEQVTYAYADVLGSPILETDASGSVLSTSHYKPFGEERENKENGIGYTGHLEDTDIGLTYMQARYYDAAIGRFYANDPVGSLGHLTNGNLQGFNRYAYANNNPYIYVDPDGESPISVLAKQSAKVGIKQGIRNMARRQVRRLGRYMDKAGLDRSSFLDQVETVIGGLDSSPLEIAFELIPVAGDIYGGAKFGKEISSVYQDMQNLENAWVQKIFENLPPAEKKKFITAMRNAGVRDAKKDNDIPQSGSGLEMHHDEEVSKKKSRASDPRHIIPMTPDAHREEHRRRRESMKRII